MPRRRRRRRKQIPDDLKERRGYWQLIEKTLPHTVYRTCFGRDYGTVVRQIKERWRAVKDVHLACVSIFRALIGCISGSGSSGGIANDYGLDGPGSNPGGDEIFRPSRPALGPTQLPVYWVQGLSCGLRATGA